MLNTNIQLHQIGSATQYRGIQQHANLPEFDANLLVSHRPDAHWVVVQEDVLKARCSLWWRHCAANSQRQAGLIGHYAAADDDSAARMLGAFVGNSHCRDARMRLDRWTRIRGATIGLSSMMEIAAIFSRTRHRTTVPPAVATRWFCEIAWYVSALVDDLTIRSPVYRVREGEWMPTGSNSPAVSRNKWSRN